MKLYQLLRELKEDVKIELTLQKVGYIGEVKSPNIQRFKDYNVIDYYLDNTVLRQGRSPFLIKLGDE